MLNQARRSQGQRLSETALVAAIALLYFVTARASLALTVYPAGIAAVWPPSGLLLAILLLARPARWPPIVAAVGVAILAANLSAGVPPAPSLGFALANCTESVVAALALRRWRPGPMTMGSLGDVVALTLVAVIGANALTALLGAGVAAVGLGAPFWTTWLVWWIADGLGMLLVGSLILAWAADDHAEFGPLRGARLAELAAALLTLLAVSVFIFGAPAEQLIGPSPYLTFPVLLWAALRFGPRGASLAALLLAIVAVLATVRGLGPFAAVDADQGLRVLEVQAFLLVEALTTLVLAALTTERRRAILALERAKATLEGRVEERTAALVAANERLQREIAERSQAEVALRESQERVRQALRLARSFAFEWDRVSDAVVRSADSGEILGLAGEAATRDTGESFFARIHPDDRPILIAAATGLSLDAPTYRICYRVLRPDGGIVTLEETALAVFDAEGGHIRLFGISSDVTTRQRAAVRAARLQAVTAGLSAARTPEQVADVVVEQGVAALEASGGSVIVPSENPDELMVLRAAGYSATIVRPWARFPASSAAPAAEALRLAQAVWIESRAQFFARYPGVPSEQVVNNAFAALPLRTDGAAVGVLSLSFSQSRVFDEDDRGYMLTLADLCAQALERARLYEAEQEARAAAEAAVRLRDQFLSIASHELKTPLTVLLGNAQLLLRRAARTGGLSERDQRGLAAVADQAQRLDRLIAMLLDVSRIETGQLTLDLTSLDLGELLGRLVGELQPTLSQHQVLLQLPAAPLLIVGDELRLEQLFQNLIYNAVKYSPDGGEVRLELAVSDGAVAVRVIDQGIGIPSDELPRLFRRFFRASNTGPHHIGGMGIGLYVAREIVDRHGGAIEVTSAEGAGSTFTVTLPLA